MYVHCFAIEMFNSFTWCIRNNMMGPMGNFAAGPKCYVTELLYYVWPILNVHVRCSVHTTGTRTRRYSYCNEPRTLSLPNRLRFSNVNGKQFNDNESRWVNKCAESREKRLAAFFARHGMKNWIRSYAGLYDCAGFQRGPSRTCALWTVQTTDRPCVVVLACVARRTACKCTHLHVGCPAW